MSEAEIIAMITMLKMETSHFASAVEYVRVYRLCKEEVEEAIANIDNCQSD